MAMKNLINLMMIIALFVSSVPPVVSFSAKCGLCLPKCVNRRKFSSCVLCVLKKCSFHDGATPAPAPAPTQALAPAPATILYPAASVAPAPPTIPNSAAPIAFRKGLGLLVAITFLIW